MDVVSEMHRRGKRMCVVKVNKNTKEGTGIQRVAELKEGQKWG